MPAPDTADNASTKLSTLFLEPDQIKYLSNWPYPFKGLEEKSPTPQFTFSSLTF